MADAKFGMDTSDIDEADKKLSKIPVTILQIVKAEERLAREAKRLQKSMKAGNITTEEMQRELVRLNQDLDQFRNGLVRTGNQFASYNQQAYAAMQSTKRFGSVGLQQVGYQFQDFFVQVQGGTNALVALGQQGSQLLGIFGPAGALAGAFLALSTAIGAPFIGKIGEALGLMQLFGGEIRSVSKEIEKIQNSINTMGTVTGTEAEYDLRQRIVETQTRILALKQEEEDAQKRVVTANRTSYAMEVDKLGKAEESLEKEEAKLEELIKIFYKQKELNDQQKLGIEYAESLNQEYEALTDTISVAERRSAALASQQNLLWQSMMAVADSTTDWTLQLEESDKFAKDIADSIQNAKFYGEDLHALRLDLTIQQAADAAGFLAANLGIAYSEAVKLVAQAQFFGQTFGNPGALNGLAGGSLLPPEHTLSTWGKTPKAPRSSGGGGAPREIGDPLKDLKERIDLEVKLLGASEARRRVIESIQNSERDYSTQEISNAINLLDAQFKLLAVEEQRLEMAEKIGDTLGDGFLDIIEGTESVADAFRNMARDILKELYNIYVTQQLISGIKSFLPALPNAPVANANGNVFSNGEIVPFADGGIVNRPTLFPMAGSKTGLMGEAGPEAIMPLSRGPDGKLGVKGSGDGSQNINVTVQVMGNGDQYIMDKIKRTIPGIIQQAKSGILNDARRSPTTRKAFN